MGVHDIDDGCRSRRIVNSVLADLRCDLATLSQKCGVGESDLRAALFHRIPLTPQQTRQVTAVVVGEFVVDGDATPDVCAVMLHLQLTRSS